MKYVKLPSMNLIKQKITQSKIRDYEYYFRSKIHESNILSYFRPGAKVGIAVGSRGIHNIDELVRILVSELKVCKINSIILPAMGSHGGATAKGQEELLNVLGIYNDKVGAPVRSSMDVVSLGEIYPGVPVYFDEVASTCDAIICINRIKVHTDFTGLIESGITKMLSVGLGNHIGASNIHSFGTKGLIEYIPLMAKRIIDTMPLIVGIGIVEDGGKNIYDIGIMVGDNIFGEEARLLDIQRSIMPKVPFNKIDYLVVVEMGKNISGAGMDTKVIGRIKIRGVNELVSPDPEIITVLSLTPESHGNAAGIGLADIITKRLYDSINFDVTYANGITSMCPERYKVPMCLGNDKLAIKTGYQFSRCAEGFQDRVVIIKNTLDLQNMYVSDCLLRATHDDVELICGGQDFSFDGEGNLISFFA